MFFKSVFARYLVSFLVVIVASFLILGLLISSLLENYSDSITNNDLVRVAKSATELIEGQMQLSDEGQGDFGIFIENEYESVRSDVSAITHNSVDRGILVSDTRGVVILTDDAIEDGFVKSAFPEDALKSASESEYYLEKSSFDGVFERQQLTCIREITYGGECVGYVAAISISNRSDALVASTVKMILMTGMWVMCAAIIVSYFISEKTVSPLRKMSKAAKEFANGRLDVRVPVIGNDEIAELAIAFNNMASSMATLENTRRSFLANVSHDLRTPMTTISGFIDAIIDGAIPPEKHEYYLKVIASEVRRLSRLVSSLLDISRIQAGERQFNMTSFDICEMAREILISCEQRIEDKKLDVYFECDEDNMLVVADKDAIHQILYNICDNGIKFAVDGGRYRVSIKNRDKKINVSVFNEGQGIPADELASVFDRFYKSDKSRSLDKTGVGLGMYIAKTIIDAHNETISVNSKYGEWCEFSFTLKKDTGKRDIEVKIN